MKYNVLAYDFRTGEVTEFEDYEYFRVVALEEAEKWGRIQILAISESGVMA